MGHLTYPNATHNRFAHSLGVFAIMARITAMINDHKLRLTKRDKENLRLAALLHDIGHYPYSHLMERIDKVILTEERLLGRKTTINASTASYPSHEEFGQEIIIQQEDICTAIGGPKRAREIGEIFSRTSPGNLQVSKLIHSSLDMDRMDYLLRDARAAGVPYGEIDINYLLSNIRVSDNGMLGFEKNALAAAEHFLMARFFMHRTVYYHKTTYGLEEASRQLLRRSRNKQLFGIPIDGVEVKKIARDPRKLAAFNDAFVDSIIQQAATQNRDTLIRDLASCILNRHPPKMLWQTHVLMRRGDPTDKEKLFHEQCKHYIPQLADKFGLNLGHFLIGALPPIEFEKRGSFVSAEQAHTVEPEDRDELIKVFLNKSGADPKSMVDIPYSIVGRYSDMQLQILRLYVVPSKDTGAKVIKQMESRIKGWLTS
jgi:HD superfamily phosphohydrolase